MFIQLNLQWAFLSVFKKYFYIQRILVNIFFNERSPIESFKYIYYETSAQRYSRSFFFNIMALVL